MELPPQEKRRPRSIAFTWIAQVIAYLGLWFIFSGTFSKAELLAGLFCSCVAATLGEFVWSQPIARFVLEPALLRQAWRLPAMIVGDTWIVLRVLAAHLRGKPAPSVLRAVAFEAGSADDRRAATRRALCVVLNTMTPNMVVIGIDQERKLMLFHQLRAAEIPELARSLGAKP